MFFSTQFADRNFAAERFLAGSQLIGGIAMLALSSTKSFWPLLIFMYLHCLFYVPTISITNCIAFANVKDPQKDFGLVRLWGTIGWIAASWPFVFLLVDWAKIPAFGSVPIHRLAGRRAGHGENRRRAGRCTRVHVSRGRRRLARPGRVQSASAAHAAQAGREGRKPTRLAGSGQAAAACRSCSCCSS